MGKDIGIPHEGKEIKVFVDECSQPWSSAAPGGWYLAHLLPI